MVLLSGRKAIFTKFIFKLKELANGDVRYKARLVTRGFKQQYDQDYQETFAPVAKSPTFRILLALYAQANWVYEQMNVVTAFLNSYLAEEVYMTAPSGLKW